MPREDLDRKIMKLAQITREESPTPAALTRKGISTPQELEQPAEHGLGAGTGHPSGTRHWLKSLAF